MGSVPPLIVYRDWNRLSIFFTPDRIRGWRPLENLKPCNEYFVLACLLHLVSCRLGRLHRRNRHEFGENG